MSFKFVSLTEIALAAAIESRIAGNSRFIAIENGRKAVMKLIQYVPEETEDIVNSFLENLDIELQREMNKYPSDN